MKLTISRYGYTSKPEPITIKWMQSSELQAKTAKMGSFVFFLRNIYLSERIQSNPKFEF